MARMMGLGGLGMDVCFKKKHRWMMSIPSVAGDLTGTQVTILPPLKSARPNIAFKEMQVEHLTETLFYPSKPEYKPITVTLYDLVAVRGHPVLSWIADCYDASDGLWTLPALGLIQDVQLQLFDGCGNTIETWVYENAFPQQIDFDDLDMGSNDILTCDLTLRYARAYINLNAS